MRPRVFPAENARSTTTEPPASLSFNEAAGIPRGKRPLRLVCRVELFPPSMRPRVFPAENNVQSCILRCPDLVLQ